MVLNVGMAPIHGQMARNMKANGRIIVEMDMVFQHGQMGLNTLETGKMENTMEKE